MLACVSEEFDRAGDVQREPEAEKARELVGLIEQHRDLKVVVFDGSSPDFFLAHYDVENDFSKTAALGVGPNGLPARTDVLVRLSRAPLVSIASIRGRARGAGSEFVLATDLRFASRENAVLVADDFDGPRAEQYGYVNRLIADDELDAEVDAMASRVACFDHDAIARTKSYVDQVTLPADSGLTSPIAD